jgi:nitrous oxidase accessory protein NosD
MHKNILIVVGIVILFLGVGIQPAIAVDNPIRPIRSGKTLYVGGTEEGNYSNIQDAIDNASSGDTVFVYNDSSPYKENLKIDKSLNLIGEGKDTTIIDGCKKDDVIIIEDTEYVNISCFTIVNSTDYSYPDYGAGIRIYKSNYCNIFNNNILNYKITFSKCGINIISSNSNIIRNNTIFNFYNGISIRTLNIAYTSNYNMIDNNKIIHNEAQNETFGIFVMTHFNTISNNIISNNWIGIAVLMVLGFVLGNKIINNNISNNDRGVDLANSCFNSIKRNNFLNNDIDADFTNSFLNKWNQNFWNKTRILPKLIIGRIGVGNYYRWIDIDWHPAKEPYDI